MRGECVSGEHVSGEHVNGECVGGQCTSGEYVSRKHIRIEDVYVVEKGMGREKGIQKVDAEHQKSDGKLQWAYGNTLEFPTNR